jgi:V/A-type H+-transporting ATPase subunit E
MNGIDKIAEKIAEDAKKEAEALLTAAQAEAAAIADKYAAQAQAESEIILAAGREKAREIRRRADSAAVQEAKQQFLAAKQRIIAQTFDQALQRLLSLGLGEYRAFLARMAAKAAATGSEEILLTSKDREALGQKVLEEANRLLKEAGKKGNLTLSPEAGSFSGGLVLKAGDVEVNCTLDALLRLSKEELALDVAAALFA